MSDKTTDLDKLEALLVGRLKRYASRAGRRSGGKLKPDKVISIVREQCEFVRSGRLPTHDNWNGERAYLQERQQ